MKKNYNWLGWSPFPGFFGDGSQEVVTEERIISDIESTNLAIAEHNKKIAELIEAQNGLIALLRSKKT